tara:strand:+ start:217 stop:588 length:372 start_codon:yes stop_codon:yes gene_type:complete
MNYYLDALKKYAVFSGRASRQEYWMFFLFNILIAFAIGFVEGLVGSPGVVSGLYVLALLLPGIAIAVRRLHDTGRSGWWLLIGFIPLVGPIVLLVFFVQGSTQEENKFDESSKAISPSASLPA